MRIARLLAVFLTFLTVSFSGGLLLAPPAGAQPPFRLPGYITDNAGALSDSGHAAVTLAREQALCRPPHPALGGLRDNFSGQPAVNWARRTVSTSDLGDYDALLAVGHHRP